MFSLLVLISCLIIFYKAAEMENKSGLLWAGMSLIVWIFTPVFLPSFILSKILGQVALFIGIAVVRALFESLNK